MPSEPTDELKEIYQKQYPNDWSGRFFDVETPCKLFRRSERADADSAMIPTLVGWYTVKRGMRRPDVLIKEERGISPQYEDDSLSKLKLNDTGERMTSGERRRAAAAIIARGDELIVVGCRHHRSDGPHRGLSLANEPDFSRAQYVWFMIKEGKEIPPGLAVIRDAPPDRLGYAHYTVAPKDDMPLGLFLAHLKSLLPASAEIVRGGNDV